MPLFSACQKLGEGSPFSWRSRNHAEPRGPRKNGKKGRAGQEEAPRKGGKKQHDLLTQCVHVAADSKVDHTHDSSSGTKDKKVSWSHSGDGLYQVSFDLFASRVAREGSKRQKDAQADWGRWVAAASEPPASHRVELMLHQLIMYLGEGLQDWRLYPFDQPMQGQGHVVMHLCEPGGQARRPCHTPWHLKLGGHGENSLRASSRPARGPDGRFVKESYRAMP